MGFRLLKSLIFVLLITSIISNYFELSNSLLDSVSARSLYAPRFLCGYDDITSFFTPLGLPQSFAMVNIEKIGPHHLSLFFRDYNNNNLSATYYYDLGADSILNTSDDFYFPLGTFYTSFDYVSPVIVLDNGTFSNYTLYWVENNPLYREVKSCKLGIGGCLNTTLIANFSISYFVGSLMAINPSYSRDKIYFAVTHKVIIRNQMRNYSSFRSCEVQPGLVNSCNGNSINYTLHPIFNNYNISYTYYSNLESLGFVVTPNYPPNYPVNYPDNAYFFSINNHNNSVIALPTLDLDSATFLGTDTLMAVRKDPNLVNDTIAVINIPSITYSDIDTLPVSPNKIFFTDFSSNNIILLYRLYNRLTFGKAFGRNPNLIHNNTIGPEVTPKFTFNDGAIIGFIQGNRTGSVVKFHCSA